MAHDYLPRALLAVTALLPSSPAWIQSEQAFAADPPAPRAAPWLASASGRARAVAAIEDLRGQLRAADSATATLDRWCARHVMAPPGAVVAEKIAEGAAPGSLALRGRLHVGPGEPLRFRHVRLRCGDHLLSEATLWYVPGRLPAAINRQLRETDIAFGRAVAPLHFRRLPLSAHRAWPAAWAVANSGALPATLFDQSGLLVLPGGAPIAYVREAYLPGVLDFQGP